MASISAKSTQNSLVKSATVHSAPMEHGLRLIVYGMWIADRLSLNQCCGVLFVTVCVEIHIPVAF